MSTNIELMLFLQRALTHQRLLVLRDCSAPHSQNPVVLNQGRVLVSAGYVP